MGLFTLQKDGEVVERRHVDIAENELDGFHTNDQVKVPTKDGEATGLILSFGTLFERICKTRLRISRVGILPTSAVRETDEAFVLYPLSPDEMEKRHFSMETLREHNPRIALPYEIKSKMKKLDGATFASTVEFLENFAPIEAEAVRYNTIIGANLDRSIRDTRVLCEARCTTGATDYLIFLQQEKASGSLHLHFREEAKQKR